MNKQQLNLDSEEGKIMNQLWKAGQLMPKDVAKEFKISQQQANVTLRRLISKGLVKVGETVRSGRRGRPSITYRPRISKREFGDRLAEELRLATLDVDQKFGLSKERVQTFIATLRTMHE